MESSPDGHLNGLFSDHFSGKPEIVIRAPGRVNLIGEHTDYNGGFVLPMAINRSVRIALRPRTDRCVRIYSREIGASAEFDLDHVKSRMEGWGAYPQGVAWALQEAGEKIKGWEGVLASDVPVGAGLSSSAAVELAVARAFAAVSAFEWNPEHMARLAQRVENEWIGVQSGIMDPLIIAAAEPGRALLIDCRTLDRTPVPLPERVMIMVMDTRKSRELAASAYNVRRKECERAARHFGVATLRDLDPHALRQVGADVKKSAQTQAASTLDDLAFRRARHVVTENARTLEAALALKSSNVVRFGMLMNQSHDSLRDDYEVSSFELDTLVEIARTQPGCFGARMTGAGFGGCAVALVDERSAETFTHTCAEAYCAETGLHPHIYASRASAGVGASIPTRKPRTAQP